MKKALHYIFALTSAAGCIAILMRPRRTHMLTSVGHGEQQLLDTLYEFGSQTQEELMQKLDKTKKEIKKLIKTLDENNIISVNKNTISLR